MSLAPITNDPIEYGGGANPFPYRRWLTTREQGRSADRHMIGQHNGDPEKCLLPAEFGTRHVALGR